MAKRNAQGNGTIRHRPDGLWEARYTFKDELGQPQRGSVHAKTQKECRQKLTTVLREIDDGCFQKPVKQYTVAEWFREWLKTYCVNLKPLMDDSIPAFLEVIKGDPYERVYIVDLFSGLRQSEILGLQWQDINFEDGEITVCRQLQKSRNGKGYIFLDETKNGKDRTIAVAPAVMDVLRAQKRQQAQWKLAAGPAWNNEHDLVFTNELGGHLCHVTVYQHFKKLVKQIGMDETRFHDLRHSTAIMALQNGCSPKLVQQLLGHFSSAFTMDVYGTVSKTMQKDSQERMQKFIEQVSNL